MSFADILGYIATVIVLISFLSSNIITLRILNTIGCILFGIYGVMTNATPVVVINSLVTLINLYYLIKHVSKKTNENNI